MLNSMTAFSRYEYAQEHSTLIWEIRSVNHRYLDAHFRLPDAVRFLEVALKEKLGAVVKRGHVEATLVIDQPVQRSDQVRLDIDKLQTLGKLSAQVSAEIACAPLSVLEVLQWPGVIKTQRLDAEELEAAVLHSLELALEDLLSNRRSEGKRLGVMLNERIDTVQDIVLRLMSNMPDYELAHQETFAARIEQLQDDSLDPQRLSQEIAILISKADVSEELDRLGSHITEFKQVLSGGGPVGRRLDFLLQEFNREANTLGSKSIHKEITAACVDLKVLTDQLREQALNIE